MPPRKGIYRDVYGRKRDPSSHFAQFEPFSNGRPFMGGDALCIAEFHQQWDYKVPSLTFAPVGLDRDNHPYPTNFIVTSPNMDYIPDISKGRMSVQAHADGRFGLDDFMLCPQWYFEGTYYLPYVRSRPEDLESHDLAKIWYDLKRSDFVFERGGIISDLGRIKADLANEFISLRKSLATKIKVLETDSRFTDVDHTELLYAKQAMTFATVILQCAPQTFELTLLTVTGFQRHFLEALACYDYLTTYRDMNCSDVIEDTNPIGADTSLMGTFTTSLEIAEMMYRKRVPVWLVRPPSHVPSSISIVSVVYPTLLKNFDSKLLADSQPVYHGHASAIRNRACQALKIGNIRLGHGAYAQQSGDFNAHSVPEDGIIRPYSAPLLASSQSMPSGSSAPPHAARSLSSSASSVLPTPSHDATSTTIHPQWRTIASRIAVNPAKFLPLSGSHCPIVNDNWVVALKRVVSNWTRVWDHENLSILRGYPFPDPYILGKEATSASTVGSKLFLLGWLALRPAWIARLSNVTVDPPPYPNPQQWKDLLKIDVGRALHIATRSKASDETLNKRQKIESNLKATIGIDWDALRQSVEIFWRNDLLCASDSLNLNDLSVPDSVYREVIWDLMEHNFRFELLALDRSIFPRARLSDAEGLSRDQMVAACLPKETFVMMDWPLRSIGLGARLTADRVRYVEAFQLLLLTWPGSRSTTLQRLQPIPRPYAANVPSHERLVWAVEQVAYPFYCQTFFDYFGRAPCVPYQRP